MIDTVRYKFGCLFMIHAYLIVFMSIECLRFLLIIHLLIYRELHHFHLQHAKMSPAAECCLDKLNSLSYTSLRCESSGKYLNVIADITH